MDLVAGATRSFYVYGIFSYEAMPDTKLDALSIKGKKNSHNREQKFTNIQLTVVL